METEKGRLKILVIAPFPLDPMDAGNRARVANFIAALRAVGHQVHFAHVQTSGFDGEAMVRRLGSDRLHLFPYFAQPPEQTLLVRWSRRIAKRLGFESAHVWTLDSWYPPQLTPLLATLQATHRFDAVVANYVFMTKAFEAFPAPCLRILDTHDKMANRHESYRKAGMKPDWFSTRPAEEERGFRRADVVLAIQDQEAVDFRERLRGSDPMPKVLTVGHLVELPPVVPLSERPSALFVGSHNPINVNALQYFLGKVLPLVRRAVPEFELIAAGPASLRVPDQAGLVKLGYVDDLGSAFRSAMLFVSPILMGTGIAIKLLDAMAFGIPCVCTKSGARGLDQDAVDVVEDDDPHEFAKRIINLLTDPHRRKTRGVSARAAAERWNKKQLASLSALVSEVVACH